MCHDTESLWLVKPFAVHLYQTVAVGGELIVCGHILRNDIGAKWH